MSTQHTSQDKLASFGPNEWIVEEMYQRYLTDPNSVDPAWHDFFADYKQADRSTPATMKAPAKTTAAPAIGEDGIRGIALQSDFDER